MAKYVCHSFYLGILSPRINLKKRSNFLVDKILASIYFWLDFIFPVMLIYVNFFHPQTNPLYHFVQNYPTPVKIFVKIISCFWSIILLQITMLCIVLCLLNGIVVTYLGIKVLNASIGINYVNNRFRRRLGFEAGIKIYKNLRILTIIMSELARELIVPSLHRFHLVAQGTSLRISCES